MAYKRASIDTIQNAINDFVDGIPALQKQNFNSVYALLKELSLDAEGNIKSTIENLKLIGKIKIRLSSVIDNPTYEAKVEDLKIVIDKINIVQTAYYSNAFADFTEPKSISKLNELAYDSTVDQLTEAGINENVINEAADIVETGITEGSSFYDMVDKLKTKMLGNSEIEPRLVGYAKQTINDTLSGFSRNYHDIVTKDLGLEWFQYIGALVDSSRPICKALVAKQYIHKSELPSIARGVVDGVKVSTAGMIADTTGENFINRCGGWNCSHMCIPVSTSSIPENIRTKFES